MLLAQKGAYSISSVVQISRARRRDSAHEIPFHRKCRKCCVKKGNLILLYGAHLDGCYARALPTCCLLLKNFGPPTIPMRSLEIHVSQPDPVTIWFQQTFGLNMLHALTNHLRQAITTTIQPSLPSNPSPPLDFQQLVSISTSSVNYYYLEEDSSPLQIHASIKQDSIANASVIGRYGYGNNVHQFSSDLLLCMESHHSRCNCWMRWLGSVVS